MCPLCVAQGTDPCAILSSPYSIHMKKQYHDFRDTALFVSFWIIGLTENIINADIV